MRFNLDRVPPNLHENMSTESIKHLEKEYEALKAAQVLQDAEDKPCVDFDIKTRKIDVQFPKVVTTECGQESHCEGIMSILFCIYYFVLIAVLCDYN